MYISNIMSRVDMPTSNIHLYNMTNSNMDKNHDSNTDSDAKPILNLWQFCQLYKIGGIPVIQFIVLYFLLYIFNAIYGHYNYKLILIITVPIVIIFNLITNPNVKLSIINASIIFIALILIINMKYD